MTGWKPWPGQVLQSPEFLAKLAAAQQRDLDQYNPNQETNVNGWNTPNMYANKTNPCEEVADVAAMTSYITNLEEEIAALKEKDKLATALNKQLRDNMNKYNNEFRQYREDVRQAIIQVHEAGDLDEQDAAELLDTLGLEGMMRTYTVTVTLSQQQEVEIQATSEDGAYEKIQEKGAYDLFNDEFGGCPDYFDVEVNNVSVV